MEHRQTFVMDLAEYRGLKTEGFKLTLPPNPNPQTVELIVQSPRGARLKSTAAINGVATEHKCETCGRTTNLHGVPFTNQSLASHKFKQHGQRKTQKRGRKK